MTDPVCHIAPVAPDPNKTGTLLPSVPVARPDLNSLVNAVNAMRIVLNYLSGRQGPNRTSGPTNNATSKKDQGRWIENARVVDTERVYQNNDPTSQNYVDVQRINSLTMKDTVTGEQWRWDRDRR